MTIGNYRLHGFTISSHTFHLPFGFSLMADHREGHWLEVGCLCFMLLFFNPDPLDGDNDPDDFDDFD